MSWEDIIPESIRFATDKLEIEDCLFDSDTDPSAQINTKIGQHKSILVVCEATDGEVFAGYASCFNSGGNGYIRDDAAWVALSSMKRVYKPASNHPNDLYMNSAGNYGPTWGGGHILYLGQINNNWTGAYSNPHASYEGCNWTRKNITPKRVTVFAVYAEDAATTRGGFGEVKKRCEWHAAWNHNEVEALGNTFKTARPPGRDTHCVLAKADAKDVNFMTAKIKKSEIAHTLVVRGPQALKCLCKVHGVQFTNFSVLEVREIPYSNFADLVGLLSGEVKIFAVPIKCVRFVIHGPEEVETTMQVLKQNIPHVIAVELTPKGKSFSIDLWNTIVSSFGTESFPSLKSCILDSECPTKANINLAIKAAVKNPGCSFDFTGEAKERQQLLTIAQKMHATSRGFELPEVVPLQRINWQSDFGLLCPEGLVRCDFRALREHSEFVRLACGGSEDPPSAASATAHDDDDNDSTGFSSEPLRCTASNVGAQTAAFRFVALYLSAIDSATGKPMFASSAATAEAKTKDSKFFLSPTDRKFSALIKSHTAGNEKEEFALWTDMMAIAAFLNIHALKRLIRSSIVHRWLFDRSNGPGVSLGQTDLPEGIEFMLEHLSELGDCLFDSKKDPSNQINTKIGSRKGILVVCEANDGEVYCGYTAKFDTVSQGSYVRDDDAFVAMKSTKKLYRPSTSHPNDIYCYSSGNYGPTWGGGHILYLGNINSNWSGAYSNPHESYQGCDFTRRNFKPKRVRVFEATAVEREEDYDIDE